jgi:hypothetical protein
MGSPNNFRDGAWGGGSVEMPASLASMTINPWSNPKLTVGETFDLQIQQARKHVEALCIKKAKLEALNITPMPYRELSNLLEAGLY